ncbi:MAG: AsmA family protein, partial [Blastocatellia bacterium]
MARPKGCLRLLVLSALVIGAVLAAAPLIPISPLKNAVELKLSGILGRPVSIASARLSFMGAPHLTLTGMNIQETANFGGGLFLKADEVRADFDLINYLRTRQLDIQTLTLRSPQINLVKNADGLWNWTTLGQPQVEHSAVSLFVSRVVTSLSISALLTPHLSMPAFKNIRIEDAFVKVMDRTGSGPAEMLYKNIDLSASLSRYGAGEAETGTEAKGEIQAQSAE